MRLYLQTGGIPTYKAQGLVRYREEQEANNPSIHSFFPSLNETGAVSFHYSSCRGCLIRFRGGNREVPSSLSFMSLF